MGKQITELSLSSAKTVNQNLPNWNPIPGDAEYTKYFNTLEVHKLIEYHTFSDAATREGWQEEFKQIDGDLLFFSLGFSKSDVSAAVDSLDIFESETLSIEIGEFAESIVLITLGYDFCEYKHGTFVAVASLNETDVDRLGITQTRILNNIPILTMIPHLQSMVWAIEKATGIHTIWDWREASLVSTDWTYPSWSKKQMFLGELFNGNHVRSPFDFTTISDDIHCHNEIDRIKKLKETIDDEFDHVKATHVQNAKAIFESVSTFEEYQAAETQLKDQVSSSMLPLKRKIEEAFRQSKHIRK